MSEMELFKLLPKKTARKVLLIAILSMFILVDLHLLHQHLFVMFNEIYLLLLSICISTLYYAIDIYLKLAVFSAEVVTNPEIRKESDIFFADLMAFSSTTIWMAIVIIIDYFYGLRVRYLITFLFALPLASLLLDIIYKPKIIYLLITTLSMLLRGGR